MEWEDTSCGLPVKSWCRNIEDEARQQAQNLAVHPRVFHHVALMPDCHVGYGMPIGGVIACEDAVIPYAVGVDIGCGMCAVETSLERKQFKTRQNIRELLERVKQHIPLGEGHSHRSPRHWEGFNEFLNRAELHETSINKLPWADVKSWSLHKTNMGTLGGGNHFIELQCDDTGRIWLMLHSGSRNLGYRIAAAYHKQAVAFCEKNNLTVPSKELAYLPTDSEWGKAYIRDMEFALAYALENRARMMNDFKQSVQVLFPHVEFVQEVNIHHNYAGYEEHFGKKVWVHRKGATSAQKDELGIIPGSMGTNSYIVRGLGNPDSFMSCSHGAGRRMGRKQACRTLSVEQCDKDMEGVVYDRWKKAGGFGKKHGSGKLLDLSEAPAAYKDIDEVIAAELDLVEPIVKLFPLGVLKG
jgi:tRNA-splicing ligase RtcB